MSEPLKYSPFPLDISYKVCYVPTTKEFLDLFTGDTIYASKPDKTTGTPWHYHQPYSKCISSLKEREEFGWGSFFCVNELDRTLDPGTKDKPKHRTKKMFKRARAVFLDFDKSDKPAPDIDSFPIKPNIVVTSSPGKYHYYWLTETTDAKEWNAVMEGITNQYDGDPQAKDLARVLRLPGYNHNKYDPFMVKCTIHSDTPYNWFVIREAFPPVIKGAGIIDNNKDLPVAKGAGVSIPKATVLDQKDNKFSASQAIQDIFDAKSYHGPLTSLAMRYVNKNMERDEILSVLKGLGSQAPSKRDEWEHRFGDDHLLECIDSAIYKKAEEGEDDAAGVPDIVDDKTVPIPDFPEDLLSSWPEPWPELWRNYRKLPRTLDECLLVPTILTTQSFFLSGRYINEWGKRPNLAFLAVAPSTGNKDVNSCDVIETIRDIMVKKKKNFFFFTKLLSFPESITADSSFIQSFDETGDMFWLNTEATYLFQQLATSGGNAAMKSLESKLIEVVDGGPINGKMLSGKFIKGVEDPNCQVLLYAQPETIKDYLQDSMIDSGLLGRFMIHVPQPNDEDPFLNAFIRRSEEQKSLTDDFAKFFSQQQPKNNSKVELRPTGKDLKKLQNWMMTEVKGMSKGDQHIKLLRRLAVSAEQLYTVILGTMRHWDFVNEKTPRDKFEVECMLPLLTYWAKCKVYALNEYVDESLDPLADAIYEITAKLITGHFKSTKFSHVIKRYNAVPRTEIDRIIQSRRSLIKQLDARGDMKNVRVRTHQLIDMWVRQGTMIEIQHGRKKLIGFTKDHKDD
jgi:hypothetical protein